MLHREETVQQVNDIHDTEPLDASKPQTPKSADCIYKRAREGNT